MTPRLSPILIAAVALGASGCWISQAAFENALCKLDEDGDGDPRCGLSNTVSDGDCDDSNPYMSNLRDETGTGVPDDRGEDSGGAYDGLDNDCESGDLIDVDGDGFPGITRAAYEAKGGEPWPATMPDELDCHDLPIEGFQEGFETTVNPGAAEVWYDGVDGNCDGLDDYDQDGDGFASRTYEDVYTGSLPTTDCNDNDGDVNPETTVPETFYDGEDQDCDRTNDYDPDGDGRLTAGYNDEATTFADKYDYDLTWTPNADCLDLGDDFGTEGPEVTEEIAAAAYARVPEDGVCTSDIAEGASCENTWYDGFDDACDDIDARGQVVFNDFDADQDGFIPTEYKAVFRAYVKRYHAFTDSRGEQPYADAMEGTYGEGGALTDASIDAWFDAHDNDCNDNDATINPQVLEVLGDGADQDCDGGNDTARFDFGDYVFDAPGPVRMARTEDYHVLLVNASGGVDLADGFGTKLPRVVALSWELDASSASPTLDGTPYNVTRSTDVLHRPVSLAANGRGYFSGITWASTRTRLQNQLSTPTTGTHFGAFTTPSPIPRTEVVTYTGGDLRCDDDAGRCFHIACDGDSLQWTTFDQTTTMTYRGDGLEFGLDAPSCFLLPGHLSGTGETLIYTVADDGSLTAWQEAFGLLEPADTDPLAGTTATFVRSHDEWLVLGRSGGGFTLVNTPGDALTVLTDRTFVDADAAVVERDGGDWWALAGITTGGELEVAYGPASGLTRFTLPVESDAGAVTPTSVAVSVSGNRMIVAIRGADGAERIGWSLMQTP